jgi:hypothetical protein
MPGYRIQTAIGKDKFTAMTKRPNTGARSGKSVYPSRAAIPKNNTLRPNAPTHITTHISTKCIRKRPIRAPRD